MSRPLDATGKIRLGVKVWARFFSVQLLTRRRPIPDYVAALRTPSRRTGRRTSPARLRRAVERTLRVGRWRPRCIVGALVLYRLLREQGDPAELVIGLPLEASGHEAHAWVELDGVDVGPAPGRAGHEALARFS